MNRMRLKKFFTREKAVSASLLLLGLFLAGSQGLIGVADQVNPELLFVGLLLGVLASVLDLLKEVFILRESIQGTFESMQGMPQITVEGTGNAELVQQVGGWINRIQTGLTKTLGKVMLVFYKVSDFGVKAIASFCGLVYLVFPRVELLGLWIILSTVFLAVLSKFSGLFGILTPSAGRSERSKRMVAGFSFLSLSSWVCFALSLWVFFVGFGVTNIGITAFFFFAAFFSVLSLTPFTFDGVGVIELIGMGLFYVLSASVAVSFACLVAWEFSKFLGDLIVSFIPEKKTQADFSEYR